VENHDERGKEQRDPEEEKISTEKAAQLQHWKVEGEEQGTGSSQQERWGISLMFLVLADGTKSSDNQL
jgi:hypothetical protein